MILVAVYVYLKINAMKSLRCDVTPSTAAVVTHDIRVPFHLVSEPEQDLCTLKWNGAINVLIQLCAVRRDEVTQVKGHTG